MILKTTDEKFNTKTKIFIQCDKCGKEQRRPYKGYMNLVENNDAFDMDYCEPCWVSVRQNTPAAKKKMSISINKMMKDDPEWKVRNSESKKGIINIGEKNGMKNEDAKTKASNTRKKIMEDPLERLKISKAMVKAWEEGKYEGVKVGRSKWFDYKHSNGITYKVQGTWELEFIKYLDNSNIEFICHRGRLPYIMEGKDRNYYPDFYIKEWNCYVDIKNKYHYSLQENKFKCIKEAGHNVRLIFKEELQELTGIKL